MIGAEMPPGQNGDAATKAQFSDPVNFRDKKPAAVSVDADPSELPQMPASGVYNSLTREGEDIPLDELFKFRYLIVVEGNSVGTNLGWALASNSVVMMPPPSKESIFLEGSLVPWVHYVPLRYDMSDLTDKVEHCESNIEKCEGIAMKGKKWVEGVDGPGKLYDLGAKVLQEHLEMLAGLGVYNNTRQYRDESESKHSSTNSTAINNTSRGNSTESCTWKLHYGGRTPKREELVIGLVGSYQDKVDDQIVDKLSRFVSSLRSSGSSSDIILLGRADKVDAGTISAVNRMGGFVALCEPATTSKYRISAWDYPLDGYGGAPGASFMRFVAARQLISALPHVKRALLTDVADVLFQRDPFRSMLPIESKPPPGTSRLVFTLQHAKWGDPKREVKSTTYLNEILTRQCTKENDAYARLLLRCGESMELKISNAGVTIGDVAALQKYLSLFYQELSVKEKRHKYPCDDRGLHNKILLINLCRHHYRPEFLEGVNIGLDSSPSSALTMNSDASEPFTIKNGLAVSDVSSNVFSVVHGLSMCRKKCNKMRGIDLPSFELTDYIATLKVGWQNEAPSWLSEMCPEVVRHFMQFPAYLEPATIQGLPMPLSTTEYAARSVCTYKMTQRFLGSLNAKMYLHAGSQLGAVRNAQPVPWDDDVDAFVHYMHKNEIKKKCQTGLPVHSQVTLHCTFWRNAVKFWFLTPEDKEGKSPKKLKHKGYRSPYVDLFFYKVKGEKLVEVSPSGRSSDQKYSFEDYFPTQPYYFGGIYADGPSPVIADRRYDLHKCKLGSYNHQYERHFRYKGNRDLDCQKLKEIHLFVSDASQDNPEGNITQQLFFPKPMAKDQLPITTVHARAKWAAAARASRAQELTKQLTSMMDNIVVDNSISPENACFVDGSLNVLEYNARGGRWWLESVNLLKQADVIILNDVDFGMARSDQQHTTRLLAHFLNMNYAWGLEYVELTEGDKREQKAAAGMPNLYGLRGNAFLTRCKIDDPVIFRNPVGKNEKKQRLGGHMGVFGRIMVNNALVVVGSVHKLQGYGNQIKKYIGGNQAVIAGDQASTFCGSVGLEKIVSNASQNTWRATCKSIGVISGDNICSNMKVSDTDITFKPCDAGSTFQMKLGVHPLTLSSFSVIV